MSIFSHFRGVKFEKGAVIFPHTATRIQMDKAFFKSAFAVTTFNTYLVGLRCLRFVLKRGKSKTIAFYPQPSGPWYNAWLAARMAGLKIISDPHEADHVFIFDDATHSRIGLELPSNLRAKAINDNIHDISKSHVSKIFKDVFGYSVDINPQTYKGLAVRKSEINGTHDGEIIECPIPETDLRDDVVYQKLIESTFNNITSEDLRAAYVMGDIPVVAHKYKDIGNRFGMEYKSVDVEMKSDVFTDNEIKLLIKFCQKIGLDFGALDVMRDKHDGHIYVVDVNKTCMPVLSLSLREQIKTFRRISDSFLNGLETCGSTNEKPAEHKHQKYI